MQYATVTAVPSTVSVSCVQGAAASTGRVQIHAKVMATAGATLLNKSGRRVRYESQRHPSKQDRVTIRILAFARLREILQRSELRVELPESASGNDAWAALLRDHPALAAERATTRLARNGRLVPFEESLCNDDELAFLPPVGGG